MGSIKRTKAGTFSASAYDTNGKRHRKTFQRKVEAEAYINKIEAVKYEDKMIGAGLKKARVSIHNALEDFFHTKAHLKSKSRTRYAFIKNQIKAFVDSQGIQFIDEFLPEHGSLLYKMISAEHNDGRGGKPVRAKPKTINGFLQVVRAFFKYEIQMGYIERSPLLHIRNLKVEKPHPEYYTEDELKRFFNQVMPESYRNAFLALLHTGMRINELTNLTWDDINLKQRLLYVRGKDGFSTKTDNSERAIPINDTLFRVINGIRKNPLSVKYPFCSVKGKSLRDRKMLTECKKVGDAAGITGRVFLHKFRHTFATHLVKRRVPIEVVQKLLGHASIVETMIYAHVRSEDLHSDVNLINNLGLSE